MTTPLYPKTVLENKRYRATVLLKCSQGTDAQKKLARDFYINECKKPETGLLFFVNVFLWTFDPRKKGQACHLPFITWDYQDEYFLWLEQCYRNKEDGITEKSRDMGASWMILAWMFYHWVFDESFQGLLGSRKEESVDNKAIDSLFGKLDYMVRRLPKWFIPGFDQDKDRTHMKLINRNVHNLLTGESANQEFSRSGRFSACLLDEFAFWEYGTSVWTATADSTPVRFAASTPNFTDNEFYNIVRAINKGQSNIPKFRLHWSRHPNKDQAWYEAEKKRRIDPVQIAQELDISYDMSVRGRMYEHFTKDNNVIPNIDYNPMLPLYTSWDFGIGDPTAIIWLQKDFETNHVYIIDCYQKANKDIGFFVPFVTGEAGEDIYRYTEQELEMIRRHKAWHVPVGHYGDPTGGNRSQTTGRSIISQLGDSGIYVSTNYSKFKIWDRYQDTYRLIPRLYVNPKCEDLIDALIGSRWNLPEDEYDPTPEKLKPVHDIHSHFRTSVEFFAISEPYREASFKKADREEELKKLPPKYKRGQLWQKRIPGHLNYRPWKQ